ncbi:MAG TPA: YjjG family noncanonical pyrimidine nucleotidase [Lachnospiraceae bacterium]|nr:YjjG family noncanonical pyrimidine nucleotidase [Lachnospiraceae bacterium]
MRYDVILWDVDGTLLDFNYSQRLSICKCLEEIGVTPSEEMIQRYAQINDGWWKRLELLQVTKAELLVGRFVDLFTEYHIGCVDVELFRQHYEQYLGHIFAYIENSIDICRMFAGKCRQFVVTNGATHTQMNKLKRSGFIDIMEDIFISEQIGAPKPQRAFFDRVLETIPNVCKDRILIVGDSLSSDMRGGYLAGIDTCWYNPDNEINTTEVEIMYSIRKLNEVVRIVEG